MANKIMKTLKLDTTSMDVVEMLVGTVSTVSALPVTITNAEIRSTMYAIKAELSNPSAQTSDWTVATSDGSAVISGTISGTTDIKLYLYHGKAI